MTDDESDAAMWVHADYPHHPGYLMGCPACEARCHCTAGSAECVFDGDHDDAGGEGGDGVQ